MRIGRRATLVAGLVALAAPVVAQQREWWFDPTQLPAFNGTIERYLPTPSGQVDGFLFREGSQVIMPIDAAEAMQQAVPAGRPVIVWGIRARQAPVITLLAWATAADAEPVFVDRPTWRIGAPAAGAERIAASGEVKTTLFAPRGEPNGAVLDDGTVIRLPPPIAAEVSERLKPGAKVAVEGMGGTVAAGRAIAVTRLGESVEKLAPLPAPAARQ